MSYLIKICKNPLFEQKLDEKDWYDVPQSFNVQFKKTWTENIEYEANITQISDIHSDKLLILNYLLCCLKLRIVKRYNYKPWFVDWMQMFCQNIFQARKVS